MRRYATALALAGLTATGAGCQPEAPPPPRVSIPTGPTAGLVRERDRLPRYAEEERDDRRSELPPPPFDDAPIVSQAAPEQRAYVGAYERVGRPRIAVFVNRTLEGQLVPVNDNEPLATVERTRRSSSGVTVESRTTSRGDGYYRDRYRDADFRADQDRTDRFQSQGPGEYTDRVDVYLPRGKYDEVEARGIDYEAMENILTDWLAADGQVEIVSPVMVRGRLSDEQVKELQSGRPRMLGEIAKELDADILVQVQARPTRQTRQGLEVRMLAEAINVSRGGQSIARAVVDVPPPLDKPKINKYTRFVARKLMDGMIGTWGGYQPPARDRGAPPGAPGTGPASAPRGGEAPPPGVDVREVAPEQPAEPAPRPDERPAEER